MRVLLLLAVVVAAAVGALLSEVLHPRDAAPPGALLHRQSARIVELEAEVVRLREGRAGTLAVGPATSPAPSPTPSQSPAPTTRPTPVVPLPGSPSAPLTWTAKTGVLDVIRALVRDDARQTDTRLVGDGVAFARRFEATSDGPTVRAEETAPDAEVEDGTVFVLDAGVHDFSSFSGAHRGRFPADVTFRGVGMDRTLLVLNEVASTGEIRNLAFEDLTLDTRGHYLADVRGDEGISLRLDRIRLIGFDAAPGGAVLLAARQGAVLARESCFEAGFGNAPGTGSFFHVRGPFLVRYERCRVVGRFRSLYEKSDRAAYAFVGCHFEGMASDRRRDLASPAANVRLDDCVIDYAEDLPLGETPAQRSRAELNPAWE